MDVNEEENEEEQTVDKLKLVEIISFFGEIVYIDHIRREQKFYSLPRR